MKMKSFIISVAATVLVASCGTTAHMENSWHDPKVTVDMSKLNKVLIVALLRNETNRRAAELQMANMLKGKGVPSYNYITPRLLFEEDIQKKLKKDGFDGAIVMRLADVDKDITYTAGAYPAYYTRFGPYFSTAWGYYSRPGYFETTKTFTIETNVYSFKADKLVWSGLTSSVDPQSVEKLMKAVGNEVYGRMKKEGFIATN